MQRLSIMGWVSLLFVLLTHCALCAPISLQQAEQYASEHLQRFSPVRGHRLQLLYTSSGLPTRSGNDGKDYYVFGTRNAQSYVIVAGDDLLPTILGYSLTESFSPQELPIQLRSYLTGYSQWLQMARSQGRSQASEVLRDATSVVHPLLKGLAWNQDAPYNNQTPQVDGQQTLTGCVATAVAQIMRYFAWPDRAEGTVAGLSDFGQRIYAWDKMPNDCTTGTTEVQDAVSLLMRDVGYASGMRYGVTESGAVTYDAYKALVSNFKYAPSLHCVSQRYYTNRAWQQLIIDELKAKRPVYYGGAYRPNTSAGAHAFVCDGYDGNGYFHFNWGWGGRSNGYFVLYKLSPGSIGLGGGAGHYSFNAEAIVGFEPIATYKGDEVCGNYFCEHLFVPATEPLESDQKRPLKVLVLGLQNGTSTPILTAPALAAMDVNGIERFCTQSEEVRKIYDDEIIGGAPILLDFSHLPDGIYTLLPWAYMVKQKKYAAVRMNELNKRVVTIEIRNGKKIIMHEAPQPRLEIQWKTPELYTDVTNRITFTVRNTGTGTYYSRLQAAYGKSEAVPSVLKKDLIVDEFLSLGVGDERTYTLPVKGPFDAQERYVHFFYDEQNRSDIEIAPDALSFVQVGHKPSFTLGDANMELLETNATNALKSGEKLYLKFRITAPPNKGVNVRLESYISVDARKDYRDLMQIILYPNESQEIILEKDIALPAGNYWFTIPTSSYVTGLKQPFTVVGESSSLPIPTYNEQSQPAMATVNAPTIDPVSGGTCTIERTDGLPLTLGEKVPVGTLLKIERQANEGWEEKNFQVTGAELQAGESYKVIADVSVIFKLKKKEENPQPPDTYKLLSLSKVGEGTVRVLSNGHLLAEGETIVKGQKIQVVATPDSNWELRAGNIEVTPAQKGVGESEWEPQGNFSVKVIFTEKEEKPEPPVNPDETFLFVGLNVSGRGTVKVFCNNEEVKPQGRIKRGEQITIEATPDEGWEALPANLRVTASDKISDYVWKPKGDFVIGMLFMQKPPTPQPPTPDPPKPPTPNPPTAVNEMEAIDVVIAPNPFTEQIRIKRNVLASVRFELLNALGVVVRAGDLHAEETTVATAELKTGLYFLRIKSEVAGKVKTYRLVKQ